MDVRVIIYIDPLWPHKREPHRRPPPVPDTELDFSRLLKIRRRMQSACRRARKLEYNSKWQGGDDAMRASL